MTADKGSSCFFLQLHNCLCSPGSSRGHQALETCCQPDLNFAPLTPPHAAAQRLNITPQPQEQENHVLETARDHYPIPGAKKSLSFRVPVTGTACAAQP